MNLFNQDLFQIYVFLYLWFVFLAAVSGIWLVYRILTIFSHQVGLGTALVFILFLSRSLAKKKQRYASAEYQEYDVKDSHNMFFMLQLIADESERDPRKSRSPSEQGCHPRLSHQG